MVHVRREFIELAKGKTAPIATETLQRIAALYEVETDLRGKPPDLRRAGRQERSRPIVEDLFAWLSAPLARLPGGSPTAGAIRYALNHGNGLVRFLEGRPGRARQQHRRARHPAHRDP
jgi:transposase